VDFDNDRRAPLLIVAGERDHALCAAAGRSAAKHYAK
jgi:hypothetical protein